MLDSVVAPRASKSEPRHPTQKPVNASIKVVKLLQWLSHSLVAREAYVMRPEELTLELWVLLGFFDA